MLTKIYRIFCQSPQSVLPCNFFLSRNLIVSHFVVYCMRWRIFFGICTWIQIIFWLIPFHFYRIEPRKNENFIETRNEDDIPEYNLVDSGIHLLDGPILHVLGSFCFVFFHFQYSYFCYLWSTPVILFDFHSNHPKLLLFHLVCAVVDFTWKRIWEPKIRFLSRSPFEFWSEQQSTSIFSRKFSALLFPATWRS